jgi:hypothetical protein
LSRKNSPPRPGERSGVGDPVGFGVMEGVGIRVGKKTVGEGVAAVGLGAGAGGVSSWTQPASTVAPRMIRDAAKQISVDLRSLSLAIS